MSVRFLVNFFSTYSRNYILLYLNFWIHLEKDSIQNEFFQGVTVTELQAVTKAFLSCLFLILTVGTIYF